MSGVMLDGPEEPIVGSTVPQKVPPGGAVVKCGCGTPMLLTVDQVTDYGRRPSAKVLCDACASKRSTPKRIEDAVKDLLGIADREAFADPAQVTTYFDFDPPSAAAAVQKMHRGEGPMHLWEWTNDMGLMVLITNRKDGSQHLLANGEKVSMSAMSPMVPFQPKPRRPVRDDPQA